MSIESEIQRAMARAFFASAWADQCEECGHSALLSGKEIMDLLPPKTDPAAMHAARTLCMDMERVNHEPIPTLYRYARSEQITTRTSGDRDLTPENFGHYCAMQAMGHGVGLEDAFGQAVYARIKVPYVEFSSASLEKDYFKPTE